MPIEILLAGLIAFGVVTIGLAAVLFWLHRKGR